MQSAYFKSDKRTHEKPMLEVMDAYSYMCAFLFIADNFGERVTDCMQV